MSLFDRMLRDRMVPWSEAHLRRFTRHGEKQDFLKRLALADIQFVFYDFNENAAIGDYPLTLANSGGAGAANFTITAATEYGVIGANTGTTDNGSLSAITPIQYFGDRNCGMQTRFKVDAITDYSFDMGFIDAVPAANGSAVSDIDTPAFNAADAALLHIDTDQTLKTLAFATVGSTAGQPDQATTLAAPLITNLTAATYVTLTIQLIGNNAHFMVNGLRQVHAYDADGHIEGGVALAAWFYWRTRSITAKLPTIDYLAIWSERD